MKTPSLEFDLIAKIIDVCSNFDKYSNPVTVETHVDVFGKSFVTFNTKSELPNIKVFQHESDKEPQIQVGMSVVYKKDGDYTENYQFWQPLVAATYTNKAEFFKAVDQWIKIKSPWVLEAYSE